MSFFRLTKKLFFKKNIMPEYVTFFITNRCNAKCKTCFYWRNLNQKTQELTLSEIRRFSERMSRFFFLLITGGEPFLRADLQDVATTFYLFNDIKRMSIMSNGYLTKKILTDVENILRKCPNLKLTIFLSLDAIGEKHDQIRGIQGGYGKLIATYHGLKSMKKIFNNLNISIISTYSGYNEEFILETYNYIRDVLLPDSFNCPLIRGSPKDPKAKEINIEKYLSLMGMVKDDFVHGLIKGIDNGIITKLIYAAKFRAIEDIKQIAMNGNFRSPCYAGKINAVIYQNGDVFPCELLDKKIGNLRDANYDFRKLWLSARAKEITDFINTTKCKCAHGCNLVPNVLFNPRRSHEVMMELMRLYKYEKYARS